MPQTKHDEIAAKKFSHHLHAWLQQSGRSILKVAAMSNTDKRTVRAIMNNGEGTIRSLLRIAHVIGCDVVMQPQRRGKSMEVWDEEDANKKLFELTEKQRKYKQDERKRTDSRRKEFDAAERERDFLAGDDAE